MQMNNNYKGYHFQYGFGILDLKEPANNTGNVAIYGNLKVGALSVRGLVGHIDDPE